MKNPVKISLIAVGILIGFISLEIVLRFTGTPKLLTSIDYKNYRLSNDRIIIYEYLPSLSYKKPLLDQGQKDFSTNSAGFRDYEFTENKPAGVTRIIVLGDSIAEGNYIENPADTFPKQLELIMNHHDPAKRYEVYNMAVGGYQPLQEAETLKVKGLKYRPDIVILQFCLNDFYTDVDGCIYQKLIGRAGDDDNAIETLDNGGSRFEHLIGKSALATSIYVSIEKHTLRPIYVNYEKEILQGKNVAEAGIQLLDELQKQYGFKSYIFIFPNFVADWREKYPSFILHNRLKGIVKKYPEIKLFDLLDDFRALNPDGKVFSPDTCHPNVNGHKLAAQFIFKYIKDDLGTANVSAEHK